MNVIDINHTQFFYSAIGLRDAKEISTPDQSASESSSTQTPSTIVDISLEASKIVYAQNINSRFSSMEEQSESKERMVAQWVTREELENGARRYETEEDMRLSQLTLDELLAEAAQLPKVDKYGHMTGSFAGTEQGDRISVAMTNIFFELQYQHTKTEERVEATVDQFKEAIQQKYQIDPNDYDIVFRNGKVTAIGEKLDEESLKQVQELLDDPGNLNEAKYLNTAIEKYNNSSVEFMQYYLTVRVKGPIQDPYITKTTSINQLMEGVNYSKLDNNGHLGSKFLGIVADAREKYHAALKDGTHFSNYDIDPGVLELTELRKKNSRIDMLV